MQVLGVGVDDRRRFLSGPPGFRPRRHREVLPRDGGPEDPPFLRMAARVTASTRRRALAAVPAVPQSSDRPTVVARADLRVRRRNLARMRGTARGVSTRPLDPGTGFR